MSNPAATQSIRAPAPQCVKEVYKLARSSGYEDAVWNRELKEARTRSGQSKLGISAADRGLGNDGAQVGYGEVTAGGVEMLLRAFRELGSGNRASRTRYSSSCASLRQALASWTSAPA